MRSFKRGAARLVRGANFGDLKEGQLILQIFVHPVCRYTRDPVPGGSQVDRKATPFDGHDLGGGRKIILGGFHHVLCHQTTLLQFICQRWMINIVIITTLAQVEQKVLRLLCVVISRRLL